MKLVCHPDALASNNYYSSTLNKITTMRLPIALFGLSISGLSCGVLAVPTQNRHASSNATYAADMFKTAIEWSDGYWDDDAGYLLASSSNPGRYDTRHSAWYATQLLARNGKGDVAKAVRIFDNVIAGQYLDPSTQWYGDYQQSPSQPEPGTSEYPDEGPYSSVSKKGFRSSEYWTNQFETIVGS